MLRFNSLGGDPNTADQYDALSQVLFARERVQGDVRPLADLFDGLLRDLAVPVRLRDVGITAGDIPALAAEAMTQTRLLPNNPRSVTYEDAVAIYTKAL